MSSASRPDIKNIDTLSVNNIVGLLFWISLGVTYIDSSKLDWTVIPW